VEISDKALYDKRHVACLYSFSLSPGMQTSGAQTGMENVIVKRADDLDIARGLGIIAVVLGHAGAPFAGFVGLYHMALFFFISGYLYRDSYSREPWVMVKKRIKTLYLPFIKYGLFFGLLHNVLFKLNIYTDQLQSQYNRVSYFYTYRDFFLNLLKILSFAKVEQILATLWFLPVLFIVHLLFVLTSYGIHKLNPAKPELWRGVAIAALFCLGFVYYPEKNLILRPVSIASVVVIMYYFGYLFKKFEASIAFAFGYAALCFAVLAALYPHGAIDTGGHVFVSPPFYLVSSLAGIYLNLYLARRITGESLIRKFLLFAGRNTIAIMALHFLAFKAVSYLQVKLYDLPPYMLGKHPTLVTSGGWWVLYLIAGMFLPLGWTAFSGWAGRTLLKKHEP
jgi:fucose 4-O-acetylase-like acetyltransferase